MAVGSFVYVARRFAPVINRPGLSIIDCSRIDTGASPADAISKAMSDAAGVAYGTSSRPSTLSRRQHRLLSRPLRAVLAAVFGNSDDGDAEEEDGDYIADDGTDDAGTDGKNNSSNLYPTLSLFCEPWT